MKLLNTLSLILITLMLSSCSLGVDVNTKKTVEIEGHSIQLATYINSPHQFSIDYPKDWLTPVENSDIIFAKITEKDSVTGFYNAMYISDLGGAGHSLDEVVDIHLSDMSTDFDKLTIISKKQLEINSCKAVMVKVNIETRGLSCSMLACFVNRNNNEKLIIAFTNSSEAFKDFLPFYKVIASSFKPLD
jgi:protein involved in sex pheromone biosynthesis